MAGGEADGSAARAAPAPNPPFAAEGAEPVFSAKSPALAFHLHAVDGRARASTVHLPHGPVRTPVFMPVGTKGTIKALSSEQLEDGSELGPQIILGNTYHLALQPSTELLASFGGLHSFMSWKNNLLTDSGGFQMVSLLELCEVTEEGVTFQSPIDGSHMLLRPEDSIGHQNNIGSDIMMQLDDVVSSLTQDMGRVQEACERSIRWLDRCIRAHRNPESQNLFAIIQGGLDCSAGGLRDQCLEAMIARDTPGYAIGGLAGGESKDDFWRVVAKCCERLPKDKPRYLMGVGYPVDLVVCTSLGVDMFDCVFPTRTARFGVALCDADGGQLKLRASACAKDLRPVEEGCTCTCCRHYTRAFLHRSLKADDIAAQVLTQHNIAYMLRLGRRMRAAVLAGEWGPFVRRVMATIYQTKPVPQWIRDALGHVDIELDIAADLPLAAVARATPRAPPADAARAARGGADAAADADADAAPGSPRKRPRTEKVGVAPP